MKLLAVAVGGALGSVLRYAVGVLWIGAGATGFPWGTLLVNVTGSFALGFLARWFSPASASSPLVLLLTVGVCGGYTTFSTFTLETFALVERGAWLRAAGYVLASVAVSYLALALGYSLARMNASVAGP